jgi:putative ABC transport system permease protein
MTGDQDSGRAAAVEDGGRPDPGRGAEPGAPGGFWDGLVHDLRFGVRSLRRSPGYSVAAVAVLALGIGANTAIFSVIRGVLLAPLPFRDGHQLMLIRQAAPASQVSDAFVSIPELGVYRERLHALRDLVEYHGMSFALLKQGEPDRVDTGVVSANFFPMLGVRPLLGRSFVAADERHGAEAVLMLSYDYWQEKFAGSPGVIGQVVEMNDRPHTIVGVLPDFPQYPRDNDVYMPTSACPFRDRAATTLAGGFRTFSGLDVFGRLAPGATREQAQAEVAGIARTFESAHPEDYRQTKGLAGRVEPLADTLVRDARPMLLTLSGATLLVLLIACANVANLSLTRTARRSRELGMRTALGAGRGRLFRQLITESLLVALVGGGLGIAIAWLVESVLVGFVGRFTARTGQISIDGGVLLFALGLSVLTGLVFGAAPALLPRNLVQAVREGAAQSGEGGRRQRLRAALVVGQVAISFVLLVGAALMLRSFQRLAAVDLGYDTEHVMTASMFGNFSMMMNNPGELPRIHSEILDGLRRSPTVMAAAITSSVPLSNITPGIQLIAVEPTHGGPPRTLQADPNVASDGYFETLGVPVLAGRSFLASDTQDHPQVAVINAALAKLWGGNPLGARFQPQHGNQPAPPGQDAWVTVVGIVADFQLYGADQVVPPQYYVPDLQSGAMAGRLLVRTRSDPHQIVSAIKAAVHRAAPDSPVEDLQTLDELKSGRLAAPKLTALLLAMFAAVALLVTLSGVAGVIGTAVSQRTRELGIRIALGASRLSVLWLVLSEGALLVGSGLVLGLLGAWGFSRLLERFLFATAPTDLGAYAGVVGALVLAAILAAAVPARRAITVQPIVAFKTE